MDTEPIWSLAAVHARTPFGAARQFAARWFVPPRVIVYAEVIGDDARDVKVEGEDCVFRVWQQGDEWLVARMEG